MKSTLPKNRTITIVVKMETNFFGKFRFFKAVCADFYTAKKWLENFAKIHDFDMFDAFCDFSAFRFFTLADGKFSKLPNEEVFNIINNKLA